MTDPKRWMHIRKGIVTGTLIKHDGEWMHIRLAEDHHLRYGAESNRGRVDEQGGILTIRASFMTELDTESEGN